MELPDLKKLKGIIALCRKTGVKTIKIDNIEITLNEEVVKPTASAPQNHVQGPIESYQPTEEEMLFWSVQAPGMNLEQTDSGPQ